MGVEREWVLPTRLREKWSLRRFGEIFDSIMEEPWEEGEGIIEIDEGNGEVHRKDDGIDGSDKPTEEERKVRTGKRRGGKRALLATVGDDSTVVYYIVHDGIVKPRQN